MITADDLKLYCKTPRVLDRADDYVYLLPHPGLSHWVSNYTFTFPSPDMMPDHYTVVPHGCATLVFSCGEKGINGSLFGPATMPCMVGAQANQADLLFIIEFQPAGLYAFTGVMQKELADTVIPFELVNNTLCRAMTETLDSAHSMQGLINCLDGLLLAGLHAKYPPQLHASVQDIIKNVGNISVKDLSDSVFYSERHLNRMFDQYLGISVKTFSRLVRINKSVRLLHDPNYSITHACDLAGFYDLSHFIHDFKSVCGITPQEYRHNMSDFYSEIAKY